MIYLIIFLSLSTLTFLLLYAREKGESKTLRRKLKFEEMQVEAWRSEYDKVNIAYQDLKRDKLKK